MIEFLCKKTNEKLAILFFFLGLFFLLIIFRDSTLYVSELHITVKNKTLFIQSGCRGLDFGAYVATDKKIISFDRYSIFQNNGGFVQSFHTYPRFKYKTIIISYSVIFIISFLIYIKYAKK